MSSLNQVCAFLPLIGIAVLMAIYTWSEWSRPRIKTWELVGGDHKPWPSNPTDQDIWQAFADQFNQSNSTEEAVLVEPIDEDHVITKEVDTYDKTTEMF